MAAKRLPGLATSCVRARPSACPIRLEARRQSIFERKQPAVGEIEEPGLLEDVTQAHSGLLAGSCANGRLQLSPSLAQASHERAAMIDALEKRLIEALKSVDAHGDVAPAHIHDPMTMLLRENAVQTHLMRWDDGRCRYVLTGTGRRRISAGSRAPGTVLSFRNR
jgi:hypothetical protein